MNFKIEINILNIRNYPLLARHLEDMASRGWLIDRIILGNIFIYKKIEAENLDFSIMPYEVETTLNRKTKKELEEFQSVFEMTGWNYATKLNDLHIYFRDEDSQVIDIETDREEEFNTIEKIGKKQLKWNYITSPIILYLFWTISRELFRTTDGLKDGIGQIVGLFALTYIIFVINDIIKTKIFLKNNRKNIDMGKDMEFKDSNFYLEKIIFYIHSLLMIAFIINSLYLAIVLKNKIISMALIPVMLSILLGLFYSRFIKTSKKSIRYKKTVFIVLMIAIFFIYVSISINNIDKLTLEASNRDIDSYRVLMANDFSDKALEERRDLWEDFSILLPKAYKFASRNEEYILSTEYSHALTKTMAKILVGRYIEQEKDWLILLNSQELDYMLEDNQYLQLLDSYGFKEEDFNSLRSLDKKEAKKRAEKLIQERAISKDEENLWKMDQVYFLSYDKDQIVLRDGKEVFYLEGLDFSDPEIIRRVKEKLDLD